MCSAHIVDLRIIWAARATAERLIASNNSERTILENLLSRACLVLYVNTAHCCSTTVIAKWQSFRTGGCTTAVRAEVKRLVLGNDAIG